MCDEINSDYKFEIWDELFGSSRINRNNNRPNEGLFFSRESCEVAFELT